MMRLVLLLIGLCALTLAACGADGEPATVETEVGSNGFSRPTAEATATSGGAVGRPATAESQSTAEAVTTNPRATLTGAAAGGDQEAAPAVEETAVSVEITPTVEATVEAVLAPIGSPERPIQLWSAPSAGADIGGRRVEIISETLAALTGQAFALHFPESDEAAAEALCADPAAAMAILPAEDYAAAALGCGARAGLTAVRFGEPFHLGMIIVRSDSGIETLADLAGRRGAVPALDEVATWRAFEAALAEAGVEPEEILELGSDTETMLAVFRGEVDFATASFIAPILPNEAREWVYGQDDPEIWRELAGFMAERAPEGHIIIGGRPDAGGYRIRDARAAVFDVAPEIFLQTRILTLSAPIPNDLIAFGPDFPTDLADSLMVTLSEYAAGDACAQALCSRDFYDWEGLVTR